MLIRVAFAGLLALAFAEAAMADCVNGLAVCAIECDQRTKPDDPMRPQCARTCVSKYQQCERLQTMRSTTGGPGTGKTLAPAP